ncbi:MAG: alpha/beta fold hydrolase [Actinobacteria bacterium]|nr:alpha/beta fold hydrolase [Actinomycetota bacterium]
MKKRRPLLLVAALLLATLAPSVARASTTSTLEALGGRACTAYSEFTCVKISVPLNHFDPTDTRRIKVSFAVRPADKTSHGLFVVATGGPGSSGILSADSYLSSYSQKLLDRYDIVFFDQRGIGRSGGLECPKATAASRTDTQDLQPATIAFVNACTAELTSTRLLPYVGTTQAVEDLADFRTALGDPDLRIFGESYGTQYAQTYAAAHPEGLKGVIIDGVVDLTLTGPQFWVSASRQFESVLNTTLATCDNRPQCKQDANGNLGAVYDKLEARLEQAPIPVRFPLADGTRATRELTQSLFRGMVSSELYSTNGRMMLTRAFTAAAHNDLVPLLRLAYQDAMLNPQTLKPMVDSSWSDAMYYGVDCRDYGYYDGTQQQRSDAYLAQADQVGALLPRIGGTVFASDYTCIWWPGTQPPSTRPAPLINPGIPTFVVVATADPITPAAQGRTVYSRLDDGYLITTQGGPHVTFGRGIACPDNLILNFLETGRRPTKRETVCPGSVVGDYLALAPAQARSFASLSDAMVSFQKQFSRVPEYWYWSGQVAQATACPVAGTMRFRATDSGYAIRFDGCSFTRGVAISGTGHDTSSGRFTVNGTIAGRWQGPIRFVHDGAQVDVSLGG